MDYNKHYHLLIEKCKNKNRTGYLENHHIVPRCLGGDDSEKNLVLLTPEEHFIAHKLLTKIYPNNLRILYAFNFMSSPISGRKIDNKKFGFVRKQLSEMMKTELNPMKRFPEKNHFSHNRYPRIVSDSERKKLSNRMKKNNPMKGKKPWEHSRATKETIEIWKNADEYYIFWKTHQCSYYTLSKEFGFCEYKMSHINMVKMFKNGWIPQEDQNWKKINDNCKI